MKLLEHNRNKFRRTCVWLWFLNVPMMWSIKERNDKLKFIKIKNILTCFKEVVKIVKRWATYWENISVKHISNKVLMSGVYKDYWKFSSYNQSIQLENEQKMYIWQYPKNMEKLDHSHCWQIYKMVQTLKRTFW